MPSITWVTPSPHLAARDISDVLEVKIKNDKTLITVDWYHNGKLIDRTTEGFTFPGKIPAIKRSFYSVPKAAARFGQRAADAAWKGKQILGPVQTPNFPGAELNYYNSYLPLKT